MKVNGFYRQPDGLIVRIYGETDGQAHWVTDDKKYGSTLLSEAETWTLLLLRDFPDASDPRLPYGFDLLWSCRTIGQLMYQYGGNKKVMREAAELAADYGFDLQDVTTIRDYNAR